MAPDLFQLGELVSFMQVAEFDTATATLIRDLVTAEIRLEVGTGTYDALTDVTAFKGIALAVAKRSALNPEVLRSAARQIDDYSETLTYASETFGEIELTDAERDRIQRILGRHAAAFTIRASGEPDHCRPARWPHGRLS